MIEIISKRKSDNNFILKINNIEYGYFNYGSRTYLYPKNNPSNYEIIYYCLPMNEANPEATIKLFKNHIKYQLLK